VHLGRELKDALVERLDERSALCRLADDSRFFFLQHRFAVDSQPTLESGGFEAVAGAELDLPWEDLRSTRYAIQLSANKRLDWKFGQLIPAWMERFGLPPELRADRDPEHILSAHIQVRETVRLFAGISPVSANLSPWSRGVCRIPRQAESVSRAENKLTEALELLDRVTVGNALDLGAAPGGWSRVLAQRGFQVDAVDPAELSPSVERLACVQHHQTTAGDFLVQSGALYDLVVSDMKMDPVMVADLLGELRARVKDDGAVIATLKLPKKGNPLPLLARSLRKIERAYTVVQARQLYFNRHEVTVIARPRLG
jgi:23S rRNA U2552 (ribose-2'-O)-methylase RlmE/FtsJ